MRREINSIKRVYKSRIHILLTFEQGLFYCFRWGKCSALYAHVLYSRREIDPSWLNYFKKHLVTMSFSNPNDFFIINCFKCIWCGFYPVLNPSVLIENAFLNPVWSYLFFFWHALVSIIDSTRVILLAFLKLYKDCFFSSGVVRLIFTRIWPRTEFCICLISNSPDGVSLLSFYLKKSFFFFFKS